MTQGKGFNGVIVAVFGQLSHQLLRPLRWCLLFRWGRSKRRHRPAGSMRRTSPRPSRSPRSPPPALSLPRGDGGEGRGQNQKTRSAPATLPIHSRRRGRAVASGDYKRTIKQIHPEVIDRFIMSPADRVDSFAQNRMEKLINWKHKLGRLKC